MYKITSRWPHQETIKIEWNLGKRCNYDCSYCPKEIHDNTSPHTDINILKSAVDKLATLGKPIRLSFTGGEPTVHPKFQELISYCKKSNIKWISVTTNGTLPAEFYCNLPVDQLVFSIHFEYKWERICQTLIDVSSKSKINVMVQLMAHHDHMTEVRSMFELLKANGIPATVRRIRWTDGDHDSFDDMRYHPSDLQWILDQKATVQENCIIDDKHLLHANDVIKMHMNQFKGWSCYAGLESLMINWDGEVHRATCRVGSTLGNIYKGMFDAPSEPVVCTRDWCTCAADIPLTKQVIKINPV